LFNPKVLAEDLGEEPGLGTRTKAMFDQVARLDDNADRHYERPLKIVEKLSALGVVSIGTVRGGIQRTGPVSTTITA
jgi:hypothetical protein